METVELFTAALNLRTPWKVEKVEFREVEDKLMELHIHIGFVRGGSFSCPGLYSSPSLCNLFVPAKAYQQPVSFCDTVHIRPASGDLTFREKCSIFVACRGIRSRRSSFPQGLPKRSIAQST
ncbi:MAG: hypothetical protein II837_10795 [Treponema sp.]|nr:hypothetical protein [Treponema sp.]